MAAASRLWRVGLGASLVLAGCELLGPSVDRFLIRVDQIVAPGVITAHDTLQVRFLGRVGPDGCYRLARVDRAVSPTALVVAFHGEHSVPSGTACTQAPVSLDYTIPVPPPLGSPFTITANQPDRTVLTRVVTVEP